MSVSRNQWRRIVAGFALALVVALAVPWVYEWRLDRQRDALAERFRALGIPTTRAERDATFPMPPEAENAATYYRKAGELLYEAQRNWPEGESDLFFRLPYVFNGNHRPGRPWDDTIWEAVRYFDVRMTAFVEAVHKAVSLEICRLSDYGEGGAQDYMYMRAATYFVMDAERSMLLGDHDAALLALGRAQRANHHALQPANEMGSYPVNPELSFVLASEMLTRHDFSDGTLDRLVTCFAMPSQDAAAYRTRLAPDTIRLFDAYDRDLAPLDDIAIYLTKPGSWPYVGPLYRRMEKDLERSRILKAVEWYARVGEAMDGEIPESTARIDVVSRSCSISWMTAFQVNGPFCVLIPEMNAIARGQVVETACAVMKYRRARGAMPATLNDLVPVFLETEPLDPYSGKPLCFGRSGEGCLVYSVGPNGVDDGGEFERRVPLEGDIGLFLPRRGE